jgi:excisionase family DNA binding protein
MSAVREFDVKEAARRLGFSEVTLYRLVSRREISHARKGTGRGRIFFTPAHLTEYRARREVKAVAA